MVMRRLVGAAAAATLLAVAVAAPAATVTRTFSFTATNFFFVVGGPPVDPVMGQVTVTFDDAVDQTNVTGTTSFSGFNFAVDTVDATPGYSFSLANNRLTIGTVCSCGDGVDAVVPGTDTFSLMILNPSGDASFRFFIFSQAGFEDLAATRSGTLTAIPEPTTWFPFIAGFAFVGLGMRRSRAPLRTVRSA